MSSTTTKTCNGCGEKVAAEQAFDSKWAEVSIQLAAPNGNASQTLMVATISNIDICPTCRPAIAAVLPKLESDARDLLVGGNAAKKG